MTPFIKHASPSTTKAKDWNARPIGRPEPTPLNWVVVRLDLLDLAETPVTHPGLVDPPDQGDLAILETLEGLATLRKGHSHHFLFLPLPDAVQKSHPHHFLPDSVPRSTLS